MLKETGPPTNPEVRRWEEGFSWIAHPREGLKRASHALTFGDGTWLIDPLDFEELDDRLSDLAAVTGIIVLSSLHSRDADVIAHRHEVPVYIPSWMDGIEMKLDAPIERFERSLANTKYRTHPVYDVSIWQECALYDGSTLIVPEALGTAFHYKLPHQQLGIHPMLRLFPPRGQFAGLEPARVLTGHGFGTMTNATAALENALKGARIHAPKVYGNALLHILSR